MGYVNHTVLRLLESPAHALLDRRLCALRYRSRRSGRTIVLPVQYVPVDGGIVVAAGHPQRKTWWRAMRTPYAIEVLLDGAWRPGVAELVDGPGRAAALAEYHRRYPGIAPDTPIVRLTLGTPAAVTPQRGRALLAAWTGWVTLGEAVGFAVPALIGALTTGRSAAVSAPALLLAGAVEGAVLGAAQAHVLRRAISALPARRWIVRTGAAAVFAYLMALLSIAAADRWPLPAAVAVAVVAGTALLLSIGTAQWTVLRRYVPRAGRWIPITAAGWLAGLAVFMLVATPLWQEGQPLWLTVAIGIGSGVLMAATVALVTGAGLIHLLGSPAHRTPDAESKQPALGRVRL